MIPVQYTLLHFQGAQTYQPGRRCTDTQSLLTTGGGLGDGKDSTSSGELLSGLGLVSGDGNAGHNCGVVPQPQIFPSYEYVDGLLGQQVSGS